MKSGSGCGMVTRINARQKAGEAALSGSSGSIAVLVIHGPNLNLLGEREPEIYGRTRLADIDRELTQLGAELGIKITTFQSNSEGDIITRIQQARGKVDALLIKPAGYTHTRGAVRDAILRRGGPSGEAHLSKV